jgi:hypothetical protein
VDEKSYRNAHRTKSTPRTSSDLVFYDLSPRKYNNWAEYEKGVTESNKKYTSMTFKPKDDARFHSQGNLAWAAVTVDGDLLKNDGSRR